MKANSKHPAPFSGAILDVIRTILPPGGTIFDPFAGIGKVTDLGPAWEYTGCEIEPEWAVQAEARGVQILCSDFRRLPLVPECVEHIVTSPAYGNRLADNYAPPPEAKHKMRRSYRIALGRPLSEGSSGNMPWGSRYTIFHAEAWQRCVAMLRGHFIINSKNHVRNGEVQRVSEWHLRELLGLGLELVKAVQIPLKGDQNSMTMRSRGIRLPEFEWVFALRKPGSR